MCDLQGDTKPGLRIGFGHHILRVRACRTKTQTLDVNNNNPVELNLGTCI